MVSCTAMSTRSAPARRSSSISFTRRSTDCSNAACCATARSNAFSVPIVARSCAADDLARSTARLRAKAYSRDASSIRCSAAPTCFCVAVIALSYSSTAPILSFASASRRSAFSSTKNSLRCPISIRNFRTGVTANIWSSFIVRFMRTPICSMSAKSADWEPLPNSSTLNFDSSSV